MYIELKTGYSDNGPAWIGKVEFSKSGQTVYFNNKALKKMKTPTGGGNHYDIETHEDYWVSGVKKNGQDRHWAGKGKIKLDRNSIDEYLSQVDFNVIDERHFEVMDFIPTDKSRFKEIENSSIDN